MRRRLAALTRAMLRPLIAPARRQVYAWVDYRVAERVAALRIKPSPWHETGGSEGVCLADIVPQLLNAISTANAAMREAKRNELALKARLDELAARLAGSAGAYLESDESERGLILRISGAGPGVAVHALDLPVKEASAAQIQVVSLLECVPPDVVSDRLFPHFYSCLRPGGSLELRVADVAAVAAALTSGRLDLARAERELGLPVRNGLVALYDELRLAPALRAAGFERVVRREGASPYEMVLAAERPRSDHGASQRFAARAIAGTEPGGQVPSLP